MGTALLLSKSQGCSVSRGSDSVFGEALKHKTMPWKHLTLPSAWLLPTAEGFGLWEVPAVRWFPLLDKFDEVTPLPFFF